MADGDADALHKAMKGLGTDEKALIKVLGRRTRAEIQSIAAAFETRHKKNLEKELISETSGHFRDVLVAIVKPVPDYAAHMIEKAVVGAGTNETMLVDILAPLNPRELEELKGAFARLFGRHEGALAERIKGDCSTSTDFGKLLQVVLEGKRVTDPSKVEEDAEKLFKAGEKRMGTDEDKFIEIVGRRSPEHLKAVSEIYKRKHGHSLEQAIKSETSGDFERLLLALCMGRDEFYTHRMHEAIEGLGTNDSLLVRIFGLNDKPQLVNIGRLYPILFKETADKAIKGDTSGDYRDLMLELLN